MPHKQQRPRLTPGTLAATALRCRIMHWRQRPGQVRVRRLQLLARSPTCTHWKGNPMAWWLKYYKAWRPAESARLDDAQAWAETDLLWQASTCSRVAACWTSAAGTAGTPCTWRSAAAASRASMPRRRCWSGPKRLRGGTACRSDTSRPTCDNSACRRRLMPPSSWAGHSASSVMRMTWRHWWRQDAYWDPPAGC